MNIPKEAIEAAATVLWGTDPTTVGVPAPITRDEWETDTDGYIEGARAALTAALPHIRAQIAADIRAVTNGPTDWDDGYYEGRHDAARIAEEGALEWPTTTADISATAWITRNGES